jgi:thiol:disulfide interchange protein DsbA
VMEFFSYGCIHCYNFDDDLTDWANEKASQVTLVRTPVIANDLWRNLGRAHYGLIELDILEENHLRLFKEIHDGKRNLNTLEKIASILATSEVSEDELLAAFTSEQVTQKVNRADNLARRFKIASVPNLVVNGKYRVGASRDVGLIKMLDVVDFLIQQESDLKTNSPAG